MYLVLCYLFRYLNTLFDTDAFPAVIPHVGFDDYRHIVTGVRHHFVQHLVHETNAVLERASVFIMTMIGTRSDELREQIGMPRMNLHAVKTALTRPVNRLAEFLHEILDLRYFQTTVDSRTIEIKPGISTHRHAMTGIEMRHISAVSQLNACLRPLGMNGIGHLLHVRNDFGANIELSIKRHTTQIHSAICDSRHSYTAACDTNMVVLQFLCRRICARHVLKSSAADNTIPQRNRP